MQEIYPKLKVYHHHFVRRPMSKQPTMVILLTKQLLKDCLLLKEWLEKYQTHQVIIL